MGFRFRCCKKSSKKADKGKGKATPKGSASRTASLMIFQKDLQKELTAKAIYLRQRPAIEEALATGALTSKQVRKVRQIQYCSKLKPRVPRQKMDGSDSTSLSKRRSSASSGRLSIFRTVTNSSIQRAKAASSASIRSVDIIWKEGIYGLFEDRDAYNPAPKPNDFCSFVFRCNPWIENENDPEYDVPLPVRKQDISKMTKATDYLDDAPAPTPLSDDPTEAVYRHQMVSAMYINRFEEPGMRSRSVSPFSEPRRLYEPEDDTALKHTTFGWGTSCDVEEGAEEEEAAAAAEGLETEETEEAKSKRKALLEKIGISRRNPCARCEQKGKEGSEKKRAEREAARDDRASIFTSSSFRSFRRRRATTTTSKVDKMATILSRDPSRADLKDNTFDMELAQWKPESSAGPSGRPKALTSLDQADQYAAFDFFNTTDTTAGPSQVPKLEVSADEKSISTERLSIGLEMSRSRSPIDLSRRKPCQQLPTVDSLPPSRQLTPEPGIKISALLGCIAHDDASTMALKSRPISVTEHAVEDSSPNGSAKSAEKEHGLPEIVDAQKEAEKRSSGSGEEDADATVEGTSAWATKVGETRGTTPGSDEEEVDDGLFLDLDVRRKSKCKVFDPNALEERLRDVVLH